MGDIKISALPSVSSLASTDILPTVASSTTSKITVENLANSLPIVLSASYAVTASSAVFSANCATASYFVTESVTSASYATTASSAIFAASALTASYINNLNQNVVISGSLLMSGSIIPNVGDGSYTSSFDLGSATAAWRDLYIANGTIYFTDPGNNQKATLSVISGSLISSGSGQKNSGSTYAHKSAVGTLCIDTRDLYDPTGEFGSQKNIPEGYQTYYLYVGHQNCTQEGTGSEFCSSSVYLYSVAQVGPGFRIPKSTITTSQIRICNMGGYATMSIKPSIDDASEQVRIQYGSAASNYNYIDVLRGEYIDILPSAPSGRVSNTLNWVVIDKGTMYGW